MRSLRVAAPLIVVPLALALAGCVPGSDPSSSPSPTASRSASDTPGPSSSGTPSATPSTPAGASSKPVSATCEQLVSSQTVYDFNPIYSAKSPAAPASGSAVAAIQKSGGRACQWINTSDGSAIDVGVAEYDAATASSLAAAAGGTPVPAWGPTASFSTSGGVGTAVIADGGTWVVASSPAFASSDDAAPFVTGAAAAAG
jgi:hypothetical protein